MKMKLVAWNFSRDGVDNLGKKPPTMGMSCIHINNISLPQYDAQKTEDLIGYSDIGLIAYQENESYDISSCKFASIRMPWRFWPGCSAVRLLR